MSNHLQTQLFERILQRYAKRTDGIEALATALHLSKDSVYRRIRNETFLTPDEVATLAKHFGISIDSLVFESAANTVFFTFNAFSKKVISFHDYLSGIADNIAQMQRLPHVRVLYAASEVPLFYYCIFPELIAFKLYVWGRSIWQLSYLANLKFSFDLLEAPSVALCEEIAKGYFRLDSIELWNSNMFDNTINQIEYHVHNGCIQEVQYALILLDKLELLAQQFEAMAAQGVKFKNTTAKQEQGASFALYHNEMIYTNNTIFVEAPIGRIVFSTFGNPNFLRSTDERICDYTKQWFLNVLDKSLPMSGANEKVRSTFFMGVVKKIKAAKARLSLLLE